jgi:hypothetical protein
MSHASKRGGRGNIIPASRQGKSYVVGLGGTSPSRVMASQAAWGDWATNIRRTIVKAADAASLETAGGAHYDAVAVIAVPAGPPCAARWPSRSPNKQKYILKLTNKPPNRQGERTSWWAGCVLVAIVVVAGALISPLFREFGCRPRDRDRFRIRLEDTGGGKFGSELETAFSSGKPRAECRNAQTGFKSASMPVCP